MREDELPENTMTLMVEIKEDGHIALFSGHNLSEDMGDEELTYLTDMINGLFISFEDLMNHYSNVGQAARVAEELLEQDEVLFEPDDELMEAIKDRKIIPFDKKKLN